MTRVRLLTAVALTAAFLPGGCSGPADEFRVSGTVTLGGEPVHSGRVYFTADRAKGNDGPQGVAPIVNGRFDTRSGGRPAPPGPVLVRVDGYGPPPPGSADGVPLVWDYQVARDLPRNDSEVTLAIPASARVKAGAKPASPP